MSTPFRVRVAASTANLGSGFDALGMALALHDSVEVDTVAGSAGTARVSVEGEGADQVPTDERHLIVRVLHETLSALGVTPPGIRLRCSNRIPHSRGLGSSAAAIVAGVAAGYELAGKNVQNSWEAALHLAASFEGHADNVAASLLGGLVVAWHEDERYRAVRLRPHPDVRPIAFVPPTESTTKTTRGLLPDRVPHADAAFSAGRAALAVHALSSDPTVLLAATDDRLHQDYREPAWPDTMRLVRRLRELGIPASVSGAGPAVLAFPPDGALPGEVGAEGFSVLELPVEHTGVQIERTASDQG